MKFSQFAHYLSQLESTSSRLDMTALLAELFNLLESDETSVACYLLQGQLVPSYQSLEFMMSDKLTIRAVADATSAEISTKLIDKQSSKQSLFEPDLVSVRLEQIKKLYRQTGDLGSATELYLTQETNVSDRPSSDSKPNSLTAFSGSSISEIHADLVAIARDQGTGSQERKIAQLASLLERLDPISAKYVVRIVLGKLRLGFSTMTMIDALSWARHGNKDDSEQIERVYQKKADIGKLAQGYLAAKDESARQLFLSIYQVEVGIPVLPVLCQRLNSAEEIIDKMGRVLAEPKLDGLRAQIHLNRKRGSSMIQVFSRSLENISQMFPEIEQIAKQLNAESCILDSEAIGFDPLTNQLLPFQQTITRKRKHDISSKSETVPICFYCFDLMYLNGQPLLSEPLSKRKQLLNQVLAESIHLKQTKYIDTKDANQLRQFHQQQLAEGLEGVVIKKIDSDYVSGRKGWRWAKIKESEGERGKLSDSLDCVVMGYYLGKGKRADFGIGAFLVGVLASNGVVKTVAKIGTGLTDEQFQLLKESCDNLRTESKPGVYDVPKLLYPDVWVSPALVVEIAADELTNSPVHTAGQALRFPRLVKFRTDKEWTDATTIKELKEIVVSS